MIIAPAISAAIEPTDRSMPPETITKVMPTAMMPMKAVRVSTFIMLSMVAKSGFSSAPAMHSRTSARTGPMPFKCCRPAMEKAGLVVGVGCMGNQVFFCKLVRAEHGLQAAAVQHRHAVGQADQFDEFGRDDDHRAAF